MVEQLKRYWIGLLVLVLVALHAAIVVMIRVEATEAKSNTSCEVDLGEFVVGTSETVGPMRMRIHSLSPLNHRIQARQLIEQNQCQVRQAIEEHLRQVPSETLNDPLLVDLKQQLLDIMIQTVGASSVDEILVTELRPVDERLQWTFGAPSKHATPRIVITRRAEHEALEAEVEQQLAAQEAAHSGGHGGGHGEEGGHGESSGHGEEDAHGDHAEDSHGDDGHSDAGHDDAGHDDAGHADAHGGH